MHLDDTGDRIKCDRCGKIHDWKHGDFEIREAWGCIWRGRQWKPEMCKDFCRDCAIAVTPAVQQLRDIDELNLFINKLKRVINERKKAIRDTNNG